MRLANTYVLLSPFLCLGILIAGCATDNEGRVEKVDTSYVDSRHVKHHKKGFGIACNDIFDDREREHCRHHQHALVHRLIQERANERAAQKMEEALEQAAEGITHEY